MNVESVNKKKFFTIVDNYIKNNKISHAYLIEVNDYDEDYKDVLIFVKMILCNCSRENLNKDNSICSLIDCGNYPDLRVVETNNQWIKKSQLQELMDEFQNKSLLDNKRIYIIKEAEKLNSSAANTILKFLEEPEDDIIAILLTKNRYQIIETILSRCQILSMKEESTVLNDDNILNFLKHIISKENLFINYSNIINDFIPDKDEARKKLVIIESLLVDYLKYLSDNNSNYNKECVSILKNSNSDEIMRYVTIIEEEVRKLQFNVNYKLWVDCLFARLIIGG